MEQIIAKCGIICTDCDAFKATLENSDELRQKTADQWSKMFGVQIDPKTINCRGCQEKNDDHLFSHCKVCQIRSCAGEKGFSTCAQCEDYGCEKVAQIWEHDSQIKENLDKLRA